MYSIVSTTDGSKPPAQRPRVAEDAEAVPPLLALKFPKSVAFPNVAIVI